MGLRKSYTVSAVEAADGLTMQSFDNVKVFVEAGDSIFLDSAEVIDTDLLTLNTEWQLIEEEVLLTGDTTIGNLTVKGIGNTEFVVKINTAIVGDMDVATSTLTVKAYNSADVLLETRTIALPVLSTTNRDDYVNLSTFLGASYVVVGGTLKAATADYDASITVSFEDMPEIPAGVSFVAGAEAANVINLGIQLLSNLGVALDGRGVIDLYFSDDAFGNSVAATIDTIAIGTDGVIIAADSNLNSVTIVSESDGDIDIDITEATGADVLYAVVVLPSGKKIISDAIVFAA
jgi:hypothetical protein